ncbi:MAG: hypothetical protein HN919_16015 [Verrucomicrobia bacterium]|jgi:hypothetical protein|nr:hypothetical protein [Verrucomicrobiota bacterium]MBT7067805.1 hypothetical protein [Verrucomicrobiota bacterium]MBT7699332.1 hypothetical protein [Verrucomicrobiota bacterium]
MGLFFRGGGLYRGLDERKYVYHPDSPKQIQAVSNFLKGTYVWRGGSWFIDGYPYGLNHIDAVFLRPTLAIWKGLRPSLEKWLGREEGITLNLYHWVRSLRLLYGLVSVLLVCLACRLLRMGWGASLFAAAVVAICPLTVAVSHFATGDIGTDLFISFMMVMLAAHLRQPRRFIWMATASLCTGMAFSCKYQGIMAAFCIAFIILVESIRKRQWLGFFLRGGGAALCCVAGILILKPELIINTAQAWDDMIVNFIRIQSYNVPAAFKALPLHAKLAQSWSNSLPRLARAMYAPLMIATLVSSVLFVWRVVVHCRSGKPACSARWGRDVGAAAISLLAPVVLVLAVSGKPMLHPFHFSFLVPVMAVGVAALLDASRGSRAWTRYAAGVLGLLLVAMMWRDAAHEHFFWVRDDNLHIAQTYARTVAESPYRGEKRGIKFLDFEPRSASVFRNRHPWSIVRMRALNYWIDHRTLPLPTVPYPREVDWMLCNGPVFLRNDRCFNVPADGRAERALVFPERCDRIELGLRSGTRPTAVTIRRPTRRVCHTLPPHSQTTVAMDTRGWIRSATRDRSQPVWILPLEVTAEMGDAWVTLLATAEDRALFELYGGTMGDPPVALLAQHGKRKVTIATQGARFVDWTRFTGGLTHVHEAVMPAGVYRLRLTATSEVAGSIRIAVKGADTQLLWEGVETVRPIRPGENAVELSFSKPFAPYELRVTIERDDATIRPTRCSIKPLGGRIFSELSAWCEEGVRPAWLSPAAAAPRPSGETLKAAQTALGDTIMLRTVTLPATVHQGDKIAAYLDLALAARILPDLANSHLFIHLVNEAGEQVHVGGCPLAGALAASTHGRHVEFDNPVAAPAGAYRLRLGVWNSRTAEAWSVGAEGGATYIELGPFTVTP